MKKNQNRRTLPLRREQIRALTHLEASTLAGGTEESTTSMPTYTCVRTRCLTQTTMAE